MTVVSTQALNRAVEELNGVIGISVPLSVDNLPNVVKGGVTVTINCLKPLTLKVTSSDKKSVIYYQRPDNDLGQWIEVDFQEREGRWVIDSLSCSPALRPDS